MQDLGIALGKRLLEAVDQVELVDVLLLAERHQRIHHVRCHYLSPFPPLKSMTGFKVHFLTSSYEMVAGSAPSASMVTA